jgi:CubicO group peptidase (beta-lactamase class C family)
MSSTLGPARARPEPHAGRAVRGPSRRTVIYLAIALIIVLAAVIAFYGWQALAPRAPVVPAPNHWPTNGWRATAPESHRFDSAILADGLRAIRQDGTKIHSLLVVRGGDVVLDAYFYPYDGSSVHDLASVTKSFMTTLIGIAADQGKLKLDAPMLSFFPDRTVANRDARKEHITVRHLASMTAGLACDHRPDEPTNRAMHASSDWVQFALDLPMVAEPGTTFAYCSPAMHLLSAILQKATGMTALDFARANLFEPLGIRDVQWPADPQGVTNGHGELYLHPYDAAKLGFLWLQGGQWEGKQIVSREWVRASSQMQIATGPDYGEDYGYGWWIARPNDEPTFSADGRGGQRVLVYPGMNLVLMATGGGFELDDVTGYLVAAIGKTDPLPANSAGVANMQAALAEVAQPPAAKPVPPLPEMAKSVSGHTYVFEDNPYRLASLRLDFTDSAEAILHLTHFSQNGDLLGAVGLDGQYRFTDGSDSPTETFRVGLRGAWTDAQTFELDYNQVASPNALVFTVRFDGKRATVEGPGVDWEGNVLFEGRQE